MRHFITQSLSAVPFLRLLIAFVLVVISVELRDIRSELEAIRQEQVKNAAYTLQPDRLSRMRATAIGQARLRALEGQSVVAANPTTPLSVKIEDSFMDPIHVQAAAPLPVEIRR
jgi:hypothetical protein